MRIGLWVMGLLALAAACGKQAGGAAVPSRLIEGRVIDAAGRPLAGATVHTPSADRLRRETVRTDAEGRFAAVVPVDDPVVVLVTAEGHAFGLMGLPAGGGPLEVRLDRPHRVEVAVEVEQRARRTREPGKGLAVAPVVPDVLIGTPFLPDLPPEVLAVTDAEGRCRFDAWPDPERRLRVGFGLPTAIQAQPAEPVWERRHVGHVTVRGDDQGGSIRHGRVVLADGTPVAGARVTSVGSIHVSAIPREVPKWTAVDGTFWFGGARGRGVRLLVTPPTGLPSVGPTFAEVPTSRAGADFTILLRPAARASIQVIGDDLLAPVSHASVVVRYTDGSYLIRQADAAGRLEYAGPHGQVTVTAAPSWPGFGRPGHEAELVAGQTADIIVRLDEREQRFPVQVVDRDNRPVAGAVIFGCYPHRADRSPSGIELAETDEYGRATFWTRSTLGLHLIAVAGDACAPKPVQATAGEMNWLMVDPTATGALTVQVVDQHGALVPDAAVVCRGAYARWGEEVMQFTDDRGVAVFRGIVPFRNITLEASLFGYLTGRYPPSYNSVFALWPGGNTLSAQITCRRRE